MIAMIDPACADLLTEAILEAPHRIEHHNQHPFRLTHDTPNITLRALKKLTLYGYDSWNSDDRLIPSLEHFVPALTELCFEAGEGMPGADWAAVLQMLPAGIESVHCDVDVSDYMELEHAATNELFASLFRKRLRVVLFALDGLRYWDEEDPDALEDVFARSRAIRERFQRNGIALSIKQKTF